VPISNVSLDDGDVSSCSSRSEVFPSSAAEIIEHYDFGDVLGYKEIGNMGSD
jgi:hypothetical protein